MAEKTKKLFRRERQAKQQYIIPGLLAAPAGYRPARIFPARLEIVIIDGFPPHMRRKLHRLPSLCCCCVGWVCLCPPSPGSQGTHTFTLTCPYNQRIRDPLPQSTRHDCVGLLISFPDFLGPLPPSLARSFNYIQFIVNISAVSLAAPVPSAFAV